jgi:hypothetical protein
MGGKNSHRRPFADCTMRSQIVVVLTPKFDLCPGVVKIQEPMLVQTLKPHTGVEAFDEGIVSRVILADSCVKIEASRSGLIKAVAGVALCGLTSLYSRRHLFHLQQPDYETAQQRICQTLAADSHRSQGHGRSEKTRIEKTAHIRGFSSLIRRRNRTVRKRPKQWRCGLHPRG